MRMPPLLEPADALPAREQTRTARHRVLAGFGDDAQRRLAAAHVAVIGAGGLGSPAILALAAAGVGTITVIDDDDVDLSNLQRQVLHGVEDVGRPKVASATRAAAALSPDTRVRAVRERLDDDNADRLLADAHIVVDGSDTFETRAVVAAACERLDVPLVWGVVQEFHAQVTVFWPGAPGGGPALSDLYPSEQVGTPPTCAAVGVFGPLCMQIGAMLAAETVKLLTGTGESLLGRVALVDARRATVREVPLRRAHATAAAAEHRPVPRDAPAPVRELTADEMLAAHEAGATLLDVREPFETATGVVAGSDLIPLGRFLADPGAAGAGPVVVICAHGIRARQAAEVLEARGVEASILRGGLAAWTA